MSQLQQLAQQFVTAFYNGFDTNKANLASFFQPNSTLTFEQHTAQGTQDILQKIQQLPFQQTRHEVKTLDVHQIPSNNAVMILIQVVGILSIDGGNPLAFTESFVLTQSGQNWYVLNDIMRLVNF